MKRIVLPAVPVLMMCVTATAAPPDKAVRQALQSIHTATGQTAWERIRSCGITFSDGSWIETAAQDQPQSGAHKGDLILEVYLNTPPPRGDDRAAIYANVTARWVIRAGRAIPELGWAKEIQNKQQPLRSTTWLDC